jgi:hypothetical protein
MTAAAPVVRARIAASGVTIFHTAGSARSTIDGEKLPNIAVTGAAPIGPSGAARPAK